MVVLFVNWVKLVVLIDCVDFVLIECADTEIVLDECVEVVLVLYECIDVVLVLDKCVAVLLVECVDIETRVRITGLKIAVSFTTRECVVVVLAVECL